MALMSESTGDSLMAQQLAMAAKQLGMYYLKSDLMLPQFLDNYIMGTCRLGQ